MNDVTSPILKIRQFSDLSDYTAQFNDMKKYTEERDLDSPDQLWLLQHHAVLTQGQAGKAEHILSHTQLPIVHSDRGGQVTWHGPGQLVIYFMFDLNRLNWNVRTLVSFAENLMIDLLSRYGITAYAKKNAPGVYVDERKIGSLGFKIRRGRSYHGLALNIDCDLSGFGVINPCGYAGLEMVRICDLLQDYPSYEDLCKQVIHIFEQCEYFSAVQLSQL